MPPECEQALRALYRDIDIAVERLATLHADRLRCGPGCATCCIDDITVFAVEALNIQEHHQDLLAHGIPHAPGACAFLDADGLCRIYEHRPYVCRTQGLPIRWIEENEEGNSVEMRDICPLNDEGTPVEDLSEDACWTIGPAEEQLAGLQHRFGGANMTRVRLRTLYRKS